MRALSLSLTIWLEYYRKYGQTLISFLWLFHSLGQLFQLGHPSMDNDDNKNTE